MASGKQKLLFISQKFPWPLDDGGNIRSFYMLSGLVEIFDVDLISSSANGVPPCGFPLDVHIDLAIDRKSRWSKLRAVLLSRLNGAPATVLFNRNAEMAARVERWLHDNPDGRVHCNHLDTYQYIAGSVPRDRVVIDTHNVLTEMFRSKARSSTNPVARIFFNGEAEKLRRYEHRAFGEAGLLMVCSSREVSLVRDWGVTTDLRSIPNGVDLDQFPLVPERATGRKQGSLIFTGNLGYPPNSEGIIHFIEAVYPRIKRMTERDERIQLSLTVAGKNPPPALQAAAAGDASIIVTGFVREMRPFLAKADVMIVPLYSGAGTRLKVLEGYSSGLPIVSTTLGAEGIEGRDGESLFLGDSDEELADKVARLLADPDLCKRFRRRGRRLAESTYAWPTIVERLKAIYPRSDRQEPVPPPLQASPAQSYTS